MKKISETGKGLTIQTHSTGHPNDSWKLFILWRSCAYFLPDADFIIAWKKSDMFMPDWIRKCKIKLGITSGENVLVVPASCAAIRKYKEEDALGPVDIKSDTHACLVFYEGSVGTWKETKKFFFPCDKAVMRYGRTELTVNEYRLLNIWERYSLIYRSLN